MKLGKALISMKVLLKLVLKIPRIKLNEASHGEMYKWRQNHGTGAKASLLNVQIMCKAKVS